MIITEPSMTQTDPISGQQLATSLPIIIRQSSGPKLVGSGNCSAPPAPAAASRGQCRDRTPPVSVLKTRGLRRSRWVSNDSSYADFQSAPELPVWIR